MISSSAACVCEVADVDVAGAGALIGAVFEILFRSSGKGASAGGVEVRCAAYNGRDKNRKHTQIPSVSATRWGTAHGRTKAGGRII